MNTEEKGAWYIASVTGAVDELRPAAAIHALQVLTEGEYKNHVAHLSCIADYFASANLIYSVRLNVEEFLKSVVATAKDYYDTKGMSEEKSDAIALNYARLFLNILTMFRSFLDHTETSLARKYGHESPQKKGWKQKVSRVYDSSFHYRLMYGLRNYAQHVGMPPLHISVGQDREDEVRLRIELSRDELLKERDVWNGKLRADLSSAPAVIPVIDLLNSWHASVENIGQYLLSLKWENARAASSYLASYRERHHVQATALLCAVWIAKENPDPNRLKLTLQWFPESKANAVMRNPPNESENS